jgi:hypothetical protein
MLFNFVVLLALVLVVALLVLLLVLVVVVFKKTCLELDKLCIHDVGKTNGFLSCCEF